jgi:hypothetical protein
MRIFVFLPNVRMIATGLPPAVQGTIPGAARHAEHPNAFRNRKNAEKLAAAAAKAGLGEFLCRSG